MKPVAELMINHAIGADSARPVIAAHPPAISMTASLRLARKALVLFTFGAVPWILIFWICGGI